MATPSQWATSYQRGHPGHDPYPLDSDSETECDYNNSNNEVRGGNTNGMYKSTIHGKKPHHPSKNAMVDPHSGVKVARTATKTSANLITAAKPKYGFKAHKRPPHFQTTNEADYVDHEAELNGDCAADNSDNRSGHPNDDPSEINTNTLRKKRNTDVLKNPRTDRAPPVGSSMVNPIAYTGAEYPLEEERLSMRGRTTTAKGAFGGRAIVPNSELAAIKMREDIAKENIEEEFRHTQRPSVVPDPAKIGSHFRTTSQEAFRGYSKDEVASAGANFDTTSNPVTVWSQPPKAYGDSSIDNNNNNNNNSSNESVGEGKKQGPAMSTYTANDMRGLRPTVPPRSLQEEQDERRKITERNAASKGASSYWTRHLRTTYGSEFVEKKPSEEIIVDESEVEASKARLEETVRKPEGNPRVTRNAEYGVPSENFVPKRPSRLDEILATMRQKIASRGARSIAGLSRHFRILDDSGDRKIDQDELVKALGEYGVTDLSRGDVAELFSYLDTDENGSISVSEFLVAVRGPLSEKRLRVIDLCFGKLDIDQNGYIDMIDMRQFYDAKGNPDVLSGRKTEQQVIREFLDTFDTPGKQDGRVTKDEFREYYKAISAGIDDDNHFELLLRNAWKLNYKLLNRKKY